MPYKDPEVRREYMREYQRTWIATRRREWFEANGPCVRCGSWDDLELDHIDPATKVTSSVWSWAKERRDAEIAKCQVLCAACHLTKTIDTNPNKTDHGRGRMYQHFGCRCDLCREWKAEGDLRYKAKARAKARAK